MKKKKRKKKKKMKFQLKKKINLLKDNQLKDNQLKKNHQMKEKINQVKKKISKLVIHGNVVKELVAMQKVYAVASMDGVENLRSIAMSRMVANLYMVNVLILPER